MVLSVIRTVYGFCHTHMQDCIRFCSKKRSSNSTSVEHPERAHGRLKLHASTACAETASSLQASKAFQDSVQQMCVSKTSVTAVTRRRCARSLGLLNFLGMAVGRRMHFVASELFSAHLNPRKSQLRALLWHFASPAFLCKTMQHSGPACAGITRLNLHVARMF